MFKKAVEVFLIIMEKIMEDIMEVSGATWTQVPIVPAKRNYWKIRADGGGLVRGHSDEVWLEEVV